VGLRGQALDELDVASLPTHALGEALDDLPTEGCVVEGLDVDVDVLDSGGFVRDDFDALGAGLTQNVLQRLR
jgi:hypothetical protein